ARGELPRRATACWHDPQSRVIAIGLLIYPNTHVGHARAIRRNLRIGDPNKLEQIGLSDCSFIRCEKLSRKAQHSDEQQRDGGEYASGIRVHRKLLESGEVNSRRLCASEC